MNPITKLKNLWRNLIGAQKPLRRFYAVTAPRHVSREAKAKIFRRLSAWVQQEFQTDQENHLYPMKGTR